MELSVTSQQFVFDSGVVRVLRLAADMSSAQLLEPARIQGNQVSGLAVDGPGDCRLMFENCEVASLATGAKRHIAFFSLPISLTTDEFTRGHGEIPLAFHAVVRIELTDGAGQPLKASAPVGVMFETHTVEGSTNTEGYLDILAPPGSHGAYLLNQPVPLTFFVVHEGQEDAGLVQLHQ
jgi:hypothetical protein